MTVEPKMQEVNVRVAVRVRPLLPKEKLGGEHMCISIIPEHNQVVVGSKKAFTFNDVLSTKSTQEDVYRSCVEPLVKSLFDGYNSTVFAYGQTGSGKTYTVGGGNSTSLTEEEYGIIPRAVKQMYDIMTQTEGVDFQVKVSYIEIYMEELRDLLNVDTSHRNLHVREDDKGNTVISGAHEEQCDSLDMVMSLLEAGSAARTTGSTQMNEHSSRSHAIFTVVIVQKQQGESITSARSRKDSESSENMEELMSGKNCVSGKFHFVDLAGSERAHRTGNVGERLKESTHINSGLLALGNVISALGDPKKKSTHIPYRDSKITRLLKDSLGGNANTLMICCISPASSSFDESLNALKYANRAKNIKNKPIVNRDVQFIRFEEMQCEIMALREELARQRTSVMEYVGQEYSKEKAIQDANQIKLLEDQVIKLESECANYRMIAEEAYRQFVEVQEKDLLSRSQEFRLREWLDLMEEIKNKVPFNLSKEDWENKRLQSLQAENDKLKHDLKSDEVIFNQKNAEMAELQAHILELTQALQEKDTALQECEGRQSEQEQQLIIQQMKTEELENSAKSRLLSVESSADIELDVTSSAPPLTGRRPKSGPAQVNKRETGSAKLRPPPRDIKSSPALFSLDRVMQRFRARSQILVNHLEDSDDVIHQTFSDESPVHSDGEDENNHNDDTGHLKEDEAEEDTSRFSRRGTYRVKRKPVLTSVDECNKENQNSESNRTVKIVVTSGSQPASRSNTDLESSVMRRLSGDKLRSSSDINRKQLKQAQLQVLDANQKIRDLAINIRLKEQLIRELVKNGQDSEFMNKQYANKIKELEKERENATQELTETARALQDLEGKELQEEAEKKRLQSQYRRKIEATKIRMNTINKKQKETEKVANFASQNRKKVGELELHVDRMKQQQESLRRKLKDEGERKAKLERDMQKEHQKMKELEVKYEQQQKIMRRKNEEIAAAQRKLRGSSLPPISGEEVDKLENQKLWLDNEMEKIVQQRQQMEEIQEDLKKREAIVAKKEAMLSERGELEIKKLRSSQMINKDLLSVSSRLDSVEKKLEEKSKELSQTPEEEQERVREEIQKLKFGRDKLRNQRLCLDEKLQEGSILSTLEERRLIELEEAIETLDAAIEYKNESISSKKLELRKSHLIQHDGHLINRLNSLNLVEMKSLLSRYFDKVICLKETENKRSLEASEMECKVDEQERLIRELESALQRSGLEMDRKLTQQQRDYEVKMQLLMHQLTQGDCPINAEDESRLHQLEKELYYYKKTSRDLRRRLKDLATSGVIPHQDDLQGSVQTVNEEETPSLSKRKNHPHGEGGNSAVFPVRPPSSKSTDSSTRHSASRAMSRDMRDQFSQSATQVKVSRKDVRLISKEELSFRRSNRQSNNSILQDSLDNGS